MKYSFGLLLLLAYLIFVFVAIVLNAIDPPAINLEKLLHFSFFLNVLYFLTQYKRERANVT